MSSKIKKRKPDKELSMQDSPKRLDLDSPDNVEVLLGLNKWTLSREKLIKYSYFESLINKSNVINLTEIKLNHEVAKILIQYLADGTQIDWDRAELFEFFDAINYLTITSLYSVVKEKLVKQLSEIDRYSWGGSLIPGLSDEKEREKEDQKKVKLFCQYLDRRLFSVDGLINFNEAKFAIQKFVELADNETIKNLSEYGIKVIKTLNNSASWRFISKYHTLRGEANLLVSHFQSKETAELYLEDKISVYEMLGYAKVANDPRVYKCILEKYCMPRQDVYQLSQEGKRAYFSIEVYTKEKMKEDLGLVQPNPRPFFWYNPNSSDARYPCNEDW